MSGLSTRITIQTAAASSTNVYGELEEGTWSTFTITGANISRMSAKESVSGSKESNTNLYSFDIHRTAKTYTISTDHRILVADGTIYDIVSIDHMTHRDNRIIRIIAEEVK